MSEIIRCMLRLVVLGMGQYVEMTYEEIFLGIIAWVITICVICITVKVLKHYLG